VLNVLSWGWELAYC